MKYLFEIKDFEVNKLDHIINRIKTSEYLSISLRKSLDEISEISGFADKLIEKVDYIQSFYDNRNRDFIDDVLFEFFDEKSYIYTVKVGFYIEDRKDLFSSDMSRLHRREILPDNYESLQNKEIFLMLSMLTFIKNLNIKSEEIRNDDIKNKKISWWYKKFEPSKIKSYNYFKNIDKIFPYFRVDISHKNRIEYYNDGWDNYSILHDGINHDEYQKIQNGIIKAIKRRLQVDCTILSFYPTFTKNHYSYVEDEDGRSIRIKNEDSILINDDLDIYITDPMKYRQY